MSGFANAGTLFLKTGDVKFVPGNEPGEEKPFLSGARGGGWGGWAADLANFIMEYPSTFLGLRKTFLPSEGDLRRRIAGRIVSNRKRRHNEKLVHVTRATE